MYLDGANLGFEFVHVQLGLVPIRIDINDGAVVDLGANLRHKLLISLHPLLFEEEVVKEAIKTVDDPSKLSLVPMILPPPPHIPVLEA